MRPLLSRLAAAWRRLYIFDRPGCRVRLTVRQRLPFTVLPLLVLWYAVNPTAVAAMSATALAGLILFSYLWGRSIARGVRGERRLRYAAIQVGDELEEQITLTNNSPLPAVWAEFDDTSNLPGYTVTSVQAAASHSSVGWRAHTTCTRRGLFSLGPWELRLGDPFGLFGVRQVYLEKNEILVYPPLAPLPERLLPRGQVQGEERPLHEPLVAETQDAFTARPYQPGDALRHIHWPITARHESPYVKVFEPEATSTVWLVADLDAAAHTGQGSDSSLESMVILLASLAAELLRRRVAVGLLAFPEDAPQVVTPQRGPLHLWDLLRALAVLSPAPERPFHQALARARILVGGRDQILAVTPSLNPDWLAELHRFNRGHYGQGAGVILLDPVSFAGPEGTALPDGAADTFAALLAGQGVHASVMRRGELKPLSGSYGEISRWEFKSLGTGRVFVRRAPKEILPHPPAPSPKIREGEDEEKGGAP